MGLFNVEPYRNPEATGVEYEDYITNRSQGGNGYGGSSDPLVTDSGSDQIAKLAGELGLRLNDETKDYLTQYYLGEKTAENNFNRELRASSTQYQRVVEDLKKAGLNPFLAFDSLRGSSASSNGQSITGGLGISKSNSKRETGQKYAQTIGSILSIIAAAMIYALA